MYALYGRRYIWTKAYLFPALAVFYAWYEWHMRQEIKLEEVAVEEYKQKGWISQDQKTEL